MAGIAATHHTLSDINTGPSYIPLSTYVRDFIHRAAVNTHSHCKLGMLLELLANLHGAEHSRFRTAAKNKGAAVARREREQLALSLRGLELLCFTDDLLQLLE